MSSIGIPHLIAKSSNTPTLDVNMPYPCQHDTSWDQQGICVQHIFMSALGRLSDIHE